jgi:hypothetical protein
MHMLFSRKKKRLALLAHIKHGSASQKGVWRRTQCENSHKVGLPLQNYFKIPQRLV